MRAADCLTVSAAQQRELIKCDGARRGDIERVDTVRIPMTHGVDSLNVAAASAVAFYQLALLRG